MELEHFDDFCVCVWERLRGWGSQVFPLPLLVCRNRETGSIMQIMITPFSQKCLPTIGTASGKLKTGQQLSKHGNPMLSTWPPNPNANCKVRALPTACPRAGSTTNMKVCLSLFPYQGYWDSKKHMMTKPEWWADEGSLRLGPRAVRLPFHLPQHSHITGGILIKSWGVRRGLVASYVNAGINGGVKPAPQRQRERDSTAWHRKINQCMKPSQGKQQLLKVIFQ